MQHNADMGLNRSWVCRQEAQGACPANPPGAASTHVDSAKGHSTLMGISCRGQGAQMLELLSALVRVLIGVQEAMGTSRRYCSTEESRVLWVLT